MFVLISSNVFATTIIKGNNLVLNNFTDENVYAFASNIEVNTELPKDLFAIASKITINKDIDQDFNAMGSEVIVNSDINEDIRIFAPKITINGNIGAEALLFGSEIVLSKDTIVHGDVKISGSKVIINSKIMGDADLKASDITINNEIYGNAGIIASNLNFGKDGLIKGNMKINKGIEYDKSKIKGTVQYNNEKKSTNKIMSNNIFNFVAFLLVGLLVLLVFKKPLENANEKLISKPISCLLFGLIALIGIPIIAFILLLTIVGSIVSVFLIMIYVIMLLLATIVVPYYFGKKIIALFKSKNRFLALLFGLIVFFILSYIPFIGAIIVFAVLILGSGSWILSFRKKAISSSKKSKKKNPKKENKI